MLCHAYPGPGEPVPPLKGMAGGCCRYRKLLRNLYIVCILSQDLRAEVKPLLEVI